MNQRIEHIARAFSGHDFEAVYPYLADDIEWSLVGERDVIGKAAVIETCDQSASYLSEVTTEFQRFKVLVGDDWAVIDSLAEYTDRKGEVSVVASCDIYDFDDGILFAITSYNVALDGSASAAAEG